MQAVVPAGIGVSAEDDMLWFNAAGLGQIFEAGSYGCQWLHLGKGGADYLIGKACRLALDDLEDFVDEATTEPWPKERGTPPQAWAKVEGRTVFLWYGDRNRRVMELEPIHLDV
jgi:hypothetical protein